MRLGGRVDRLERAVATGATGAREAELDALFAAISTEDLYLLLAASRARQEGRPLAAEERDVLDRHAPTLARLAEVGAR